jgi:hypothetical protein
MKPVSKFIETTREILPAFQAVRMTLLRFFFLVSPANPCYLKAANSTAYRCYCSPQIVFFVFSKNHVYPE